MAMDLPMSRAVGIDCRWRNVLIKAGIYLSCFATAVRNRWRSKPQQKCYSRLMLVDGIPIGSMYGIYANIWGILMVNVTIYSSTMDPMGYGASSENKATQKFHWAPHYTISVLISGGDS